MQGSHDKNAFPDSSVGWITKVKVPTGSVFGKRKLPQSLALLTETQVLLIEIPTHPPHNSLNTITSP